MDNGYSLSDLRAATGDGNGFGGNGAWWIVILFLFYFMGVSPHGKRCAGFFEKRSIVLWLAMKG